MDVKRYIELEKLVALLAEGVDRNSLRTCGKPRSSLVALLAEGVDRNAKVREGLLSSDVALLAEGVDRNYCSVGVPARIALSPSSRRAWIEILTRYPKQVAKEVALLAEGVDRNYFENMDD